MEFTVPVTVTRQVPFPVETAYEWLTDYRDDDADRTGTVIEDRRVVEESEDRVVLEGETSVLGRTRDGRAEVTLDPPGEDGSEARWVATIVEGPAEGSRYVYELTAAGEGASHLEVTYNIPVEGLVDRVKFWLVESKVESQLGDMWDGFIEAMEEELGEEAEAAEAAA